MTRRQLLTSAVAALTSMACAPMLAHRPKAATATICGHVLRGVRRDGTPMLYKHPLRMPVMLYRMEGFTDDKGDPELYITRMLPTKFVGKAFTNDQGYYEFRDVEMGDYVLMFWAQGKSQITNVRGPFTYWANPTVL